MPLLTEPCEASDTERPDSSGPVGPTPTTVTGTDDGSDPGVRSAPGALGHCPSHRSLLEHVLPPSRQLIHGEGQNIRHRVGAIVVPTIRAFDPNGNGLRLATELAAAHQAPLLVLCSGQARRAEFCRSVASPRTQGIAVLDFGEVKLTLPQLTTSQLLETGQRSPEQKGNLRDLGDKRNLGLLLARSSGWDTLLFLDDDVRPVPSHDHTVRTLDAGGLSAAVGHLRDNPDTGAVGWTLTDFDDNSVVCHARRALGMPQDQFVSGGALLVRVDEQIPFFPKIYNEDWLFMFELLWRQGKRGKLAEGGNVLQDVYDPFIPYRAHFEEAGDVLAEGLLTLLHDGPDPSDPERFLKDDAYWSAVLSQRAAMTGDMCQRLGSSSLVPQEKRDRISSALHAAEGARSRLRSGDFVDYLQAWFDDLTTWRNYLDVTASPSLYWKLGLDKCIRWCDDGCPERFGWENVPRT